MLMAQPYNNEWIDYSKTYYKFKLGSGGLYRINQSNLPVNLQSVPAEQFQLWRNGKEISIYTSAATGILPSSGYIEFWGQKNDGKPDKALYKNQANQFSDALSLETDTAAYFLTINTAPNARLTDAVNNVAGNILPPEPYFLYTYQNNIQTMINRGRASYFGQYVYSSTYDIGEWWSSGDIYPASPLNINPGNLFVAPTGPAGVVSFSAAGNSYLGSNRTVSMEINGTQVINQPLPSLNAAIFSNNSIPLTLINNPTPTFTILDNNGDKNDRIVCGFISLTYPRQFNFGGSSNFEFSLPATATGNYLEISNFTWGGLNAPVLYDLTNGKRYAANTALPNVLRFALPPGSSERNLVLVSEDPSNIITITNLAGRNFISFASGVNQGNYLIISNKILTGIPLSGAVKNYADYRSSAAGGNYNSKVYDIDELTDQFAFGIKKHPLAVKNFLQYARNNFSVKPAFAFLIGKAVSYDEAKQNEGSPYIDRLDLVPTFGWPASDNILASDNLEPIAAMPIGRLAAISSEEVQIYLDKVKEYELQQASTLQTIANKAWMKTNVHVTGANDAALDLSLTSHLNNYRTIIQDTLFGGNVYSFNKTSTGTATPITDALMTSLFNNGISLLNYFGHSSATVLDYNLNSPYDYNNKGKYPVFLINGCDAGNIYSFDTARLSLISSLSEKFVLAKDRGAIAFIASTHFGVENYLDVYDQGFYKSLAGKGYNGPVANNMIDGVKYLLSVPYDSITKTLHGEETILHGDPAIRINACTKPDFVIEEPQVFINPTFVSVADNSFDVKCFFYNIGMATGKFVSVLIKRQYPDGSIDTLLSQQLPSIRYIDSVALTVPIIASRDKGENKLIISIDNSSKYDELSETNNTVTKSFFIYEDELKPVYPYNFAIVNKPNIKLVASTANPVSTSRAYTMEIDSTELFNSSIKKTQTIVSVGGILEFDPGIIFSDSMVYYWRVAPVPEDGNYRWNNSSFIYLPGSNYGYNQSHLYQHLKSTGDRIFIDSFSRRWNYKDILSSLTLINSIFPVSGKDDADFQVQINGLTVTAAACLGHSVIFNLFDPVTLQPYFNQTVPSTNGSGNYGLFYGSSDDCIKQGSEHNFEFSYLDTTGRRKMRDFMDWIPNGLLVTARIILDAPYDQNPFAPTWKADEAVYGPGNTLYQRLKDAGFNDLDSFYYPRTWVFNYKKNVPSYAGESKLSAGLFDQVFYNRTITSADSLGFISSPVFGPANAWKQVKWRGSSLDSKAGDKATIDVTGITASGVSTILYTLNNTQQDFDISTVNAATYPYIQLKMRNSDSINLTPYQLRYWRILYDPVPEGALAANILYTFKDTVALGQTEDIAIAFKNISEVSFADSILVNMTVFDAGNNAIPQPAIKLKQLKPGDTAVIKYSIDTRNLSGLNNLFIDVNPDNNQPEQYHFNNFLYKNFAVNIDNFKPVLDVTFDGMHILNNDIVSAQPHITIKMKDESSFLLLDDTSLMTVQLQYPDGNLRRFYFSTDTLLFTPPSSAADNIATVDFTPYLTDDGQYQLIVTGKDKTGNTAGNISYTVSFQVYNKPMITNLFNYPNPFTTSTAFVFTITGSEVPQNLRIQILTITGKIVKEITKAELNDLHIGRNITGYKWDGTDQYGQKLANGVYIYRVLTNLNGKGLDKFGTFDKNGSTIDTDKYFNKGYGKMYLMR